MKDFTEILAIFQIKNLKKNNMNILNDNKN